MTKIGIPLVDLAAGYREHREEIDACIARVAQSGWYILGREVANFEESFAEWLGIGHVVGVANGTDAITLALKSLRIGPGDAVFTVSHTAVATVAAIELAGATPVLVDVEPESRNIDLNKLSEALRKNTQLKPRAVVAVHLYGNACDIAGLMSLCAEHGLELIEDCAQAHGTKIGNLRAGTFGSAGAFSFYPTKNLGAFGDAGAIAFRDSNAADRCRALREYGWTTRYVSEFQGLNSRLDEFQAAILNTKLRHLNREVEVRQSIARMYDEGLQNLLSIPKAFQGTTHAYHLYVIQTVNRDMLKAALESAGIGSAIHYPVPVHLQPAYVGRILLGPGGLSVTETLAQEALSLPMHPFLAPPEARRVIDTVANWVTNGRSKAS